jgi:hypothetical protein
MRTSRCAIASSLERNTRAIACVGRLHTVRSVSAVFVPLGFGRPGVERLAFENRQFRAQHDAAANRVDALVPSDTHQPCAWICGQPYHGPLRECRDEGFLLRFLGEIEIAEQADQRREDAIRLLAEHAFDVACGGLRQPVGHVGRTSMLP